MLTPFCICLYEWQEAKKEGPYGSSSTCVRKRAPAKFPFLVDMNVKFSFYAVFCMAYHLMNTSYSVWVTLCSRHHPSHEKSTELVLEIQMTYKKSEFAV